MSEKLSLGIEITADASKVLSSLRTTQKALLDTYAGANGEVAALNEKLAQSRVRAAELAKGLSASGPPTKAMVADFERARSAVNAAKDAVLAQTQAMQKARLAARENAEAMAQVSRQAQASAQADALAARARSSAAASRNAAISGSMSALGLRGSTAIRQEISDINRAVASLRANGAAAQDIARASEQAKTRVAALSRNWPVLARRLKGHKAAWLAPHIVWPRWLLRQSRRNRRFSSCVIRSIPASSSTA